MQVLLMVKDGPNAAVELPMFLIGRDPQCHLRLDAKGVSRVHCSIITRDNDVFLRDENSSYGTFVNKRRLRGELQLLDDDNIQLGSQLLHISITREADDTLEPASAASEPVNTQSTIASSVPLIDPDELEDEEEERLRDRFKNI